MDSSGLVDHGGSKTCTVTGEDINGASVVLEKCDSDSKGLVEGHQSVEKPSNDDARFGREYDDEMLPSADSEKAVCGKSAMSNEVEQGVESEIDSDSKGLVEGHQSVRNPLNDDGEKTVGVESEEVEDGERSQNEAEFCAPDLVGEKTVGVESEEVEDGERSKNEAEFHATDLVWGKVRSHPWWPGQIVAPSDASHKARKHSVANSYLVAYFGDHTFAWNRKAKLKPFVPHFSQLVKQTGMEAFRCAVGCALDEVSRRVEFGLSCTCVNDDVWNKLKTQVVDNAGVKEPQIQHERQADGCFSASSFRPVELLDYVNSLAVEPHAEVDKLEYVVARGRISAFYRWKGYYHLPEFGPLIGYVNNEADAPITTHQKEEKSEVIDAHKVDEEVTLTEHGRKRKNLSGSSSSCRPTKKEKCLADMVLEKKGSYKRDRDEKKTQGKTDRKSISSSSSTGKASELSNNGSKTETPKDAKPCFRVGASILRVAGELSKPSPLLKLDTSTTCMAKGGGSKRNKSRTRAHEEYGGTDVIEEGQVFFDEKMQPTALTLKFTDIDSIPSEAKLNQIFSHFGALRESETQILTKKTCARVVFERRLDAETAFSSSGKFETFGPSLVCYRLNDVSSSPRKFPSRTKGDSPQKGNET